MLSVETDTLFVPRPWDCSAEIRWELRYKNWNTTTSHGYVLLRCGRAEGGGGGGVVMKQVFDVILSLRADKTEKNLKIEVIKHRMLFVIFVAVKPLCL